METFDNDKINELIKNYLVYANTNRPNIDEQIRKNNVLLSEFMERYGRDKLPSMTLKEYCFEKGVRDSYCYWLDNTLNDLCDIHINSTCGFQKFHIQKVNGIYVFKRKNQINCWAGDNPNDVFKSVQREIIKIVDAAINYPNDVDIIDKSKIHETTKAKITYLYAPEKWIPICVNNDTDAILSYFGVKVLKKESLTVKRIMLYELFTIIKEKISNITTWEFMDFIYNDKGLRYIIKSNKGNTTSKKKSNAEPNKHSLDKFHEGTLSNKTTINVIQDQYLENNDVVDVKQKEEEENNKKLVGKMGERIVYKYLKTNKKTMGISKIYKPCLENRHNLHHDFSYVMNNVMYYVEVKSSSRKNDEFHIEMSWQEYEFMSRHIDNYFIYYVEDALNNPTIHIIEGKDIITKLSVSKYKINGKLN